MRKGAVSEKVSVSQTISNSHSLQCCLLHPSLFLLLNSACLTIWLACYISIIYISFNLLFYAILSFLPCSLLKPLCLIHLEVSSHLPPPLLPVCESICFRARNIQKCSWWTRLKHPLHPPPPLHRDPCCLGRCEWRSSCSWLKAKHIASHPQQFKYWITAQFFSV